MERLWPILFQRPMRLEANLRLALVSLSQSYQIERARFKRRISFCFAIGSILIFPVNKKFLRRRKWCLETESDRRHRDFQSLALPTELSRRMSLDYTYFSTEVKDFFEKTGPIVDFMPLTGRLRQHGRCL